MTARFSLGQTVATPGVLATLEESGQSPAEFLTRHISGDFGELDTEDRQANEDALIHGERLLSAYRTHENLNTTSRYSQKSEQQLAVSSERVNW